MTFFKEQGSRCADASLLTCSVLGMRTLMVATCRRGLGVWDKQKVQMSRNNDKNLIQPWRCSWSYLTEASEETRTDPFSKTTTQVKVNQRKNSPTTNGEEGIFKSASLSPTGQLVIFSLSAKTVTEEQRSQVWKGILMAHKKVQCLIEAPRVKHYGQ